MKIGSRVKVIGPLWSAQFGQCGEVVLILSAKDAYPEQMAPRGIPKKGIDQNQAVVTVKMDDGRIRNFYIENLEVI